MKQIPLPLKIQFEQEGSDLKCKPFPSYQTWETIYEGVDSSAEIEDINEAIAALDATDEALIESIALVGADAAAAQATADNALAVAGVGAKLFEMFSDAANVSGGTPTTLDSTSYRYNFIRFTAVLNAQFEWKFASDLSAGATINVLFAQGSGACTCDCYINGVGVTSRDMSTGGSNNHQTWTMTLSASVHGLALHTLTLKAGGTGSVGAAYGLSITKVWIVVN